MRHGIFNENLKKEAFIFLIVAGFLLVGFSTFGLYTVNLFSSSQKTVPSPSAAIMPAPNKWLSTWGGALNEEGNSICGDGTRLYTVGYTSSFGSGSTDFAVVAWDQRTGTKLWNNTWGGNQLDYGYSIWSDPLQVYTTGSTYSFGSGSSDIALVAWNAITGEKVWNKTWGGSSTEQGLSIWGDGTRLYTAGWTTSFGSGDEDMALIAWNPSIGTILWNVSLGGVLTDQANSVWGDGTHIYTAGYTESCGAGGQDFAVAAWDSLTGAKLWNTTWGRQWQDEAQAIWGDGTNLYVVGFANPTSDVASDFAIVAFDAITGARVWNTTWGGSKWDEYTSIWGDGTRLYISGYTYSFGGGKNDAIICAVDPKNGNLLWNTLWGDSNSQAFVSTLGNRSMLYCTGNTNSSGAGMFDMVIGAWDVHFSVTQPDDLTYVSGTSDNMMSWTISCATVLSGSFEISRDGVVFTSGTWSSNNAIGIDVDDLAIGIHTFKLVALDGFGGLVEDMVDVVVTTPVSTQGTTPGTPDSDKWGTTEILLVGVILMLFLVFIAVLKRNRPVSSQSPERNVSLPLSNNKDMEKHRVQTTKPESPNPKVK